MPLVNAEVLDDQFDDAENEQYMKAMRFSLADMPSPRPATLTVSTAPGFSFTLVIPKQAGVWRGARSERGLAAPRQSIEALFAQQQQRRQSHKPCCREIVAHVGEPIVSGQPRGD